MTLLKKIAHAQLRKFERRWKYDASYGHEVLDEAGIGALAPLGAIQRLGKYRVDVPLNTYYGATLTAARQADCGPCLQLGVAMAESEGVAPDVIRAILADDSALPEDAKLGVELARATMARDLSGEEARAEILRRWGRRALVSLAYGMIAAQAYPAFKYALGYGRTCAQVKVGGRNLEMKEAAPA